MSERCEICGVDGAVAPLHWSNGDGTGLRVCGACSGAVDTVVALRAQIAKLRAIICRNCRFERAACPEECAREDVRAALEGKSKS